MLSTQSNNGLLYAQGGDQLDRLMKSLRLGSPCVLILSFRHTSSAQIRIGRRDVDCPQSNLDIAQCGDAVVSPDTHFNLSIIASAVTNRVEPIRGGVTAVSDLRAFGCSVFSPRGP